MLHLFIEQNSGPDENAGRRGFLRRMAGLGLLGGVSALGLGSWTSGTQTLAPVRKRKLKPVLVGDWWLIGKTPADLRPPSGETLQKLVRDRLSLSGRPESAYDDYGQVLAANLTKVEPVDHHIFRGPDGYWHLWGCVRNTDVGRVLFHWRSRTLEASPWEETGEIIRADRAAGECIDDYYGQEWMQSPYFVRHRGMYYMFYGGHSTGKDAHGNPVSGDPPSVEMRQAQCQICLMTSRDGINWTRYRDANGFSRVFVGPGQARDPSVIRIGKTWHMYYTGDEGNHLIGGIYVRTSEDLIHWSDYRHVFHNSNFGATTWQHECPHVVYRDGYYYLFVTENYAKARSHVYRSEDPLDFGKMTEASTARYVGLLACAAPEIYTVNGKDYISSNHNPPLGTQMSRLDWVPEE